MARLVGVRANLVIAVAFAISGVLASFVSLYLVAQTGSVSYKMGVNMVLIAFVASVIGGMGSLTGAALGGFLVGIVSVIAAGLPAGGAAALSRRLRLPALHRLPAVAARRDCWSGAPIGSGSSHGAGAICLRRAEAVADRGALLAGAAGRRRGRRPLPPPALQRTVIEALIKLIVVIGLYIFVGNSGVFSFGHVAFMAIGGYVSAILTIAPAKKAVAARSAAIPGSIAAARRRGRW